MIREQLALNEFYITELKQTGLCCKPLPFGRGFFMFLDKVITITYLE